MYEEIKNNFGFSLAVPASDANLVRDLPMWLKMAGSHSKCVLVFDALNQLDDGSGEEGTGMYAGCVNYDCQAPTHVGLSIGHRFPLSLNVITCQSNKTVIFGKGELATSNIMTTDFSSVNNS